MKVDIFQLRLMRIVIDTVVIFSHSDDGQEQDCDVTSNTLTMGCEEGMRNKPANSRSCTVPGNEELGVTRFYVCLLMFVSFLCGCGSSGHAEKSWTEDVQLDDGSIIKIQRYVAFNTSNALGGGAYNAVETKSTLSVLDGRSSLPTWDIPLVPLLLYRDRVTQEWVVVAYTSSCEMWRKRGKPKPPYWEFRLTNGSWYETALSPSSLGRETNLFFNYNAKFKVKEMTTQKKDLMQSDRRISKNYREIVAHESSCY